MISELEQSGYEVAWRGNHCAARLNGQWIEQSYQECPQCQQGYVLASFIGHRGNLHAWCEQCRRADPKGAKQAQDRAYQKQRAAERPQEERQRLLEKKRAREQARHDEQKAAEGVALAMVTAAIDQIDLSGYSMAQQKVISAELQQIRKRIEGD